MKAIVTPTESQETTTKPVDGSSGKKLSIRSKHGLFEYLRVTLLNALEHVGWPVFWVVLALVLIIPSAAFLVLAVSPHLFGQGSAWFSLSSFSSALSGVTLQGMRNSVVVGVVAAIFATFVGSFLGFGLQRTNMKGKAVFSVAIWGILLLPSYIIAVGWQVLLDRGGVLSSINLFSPKLLNLFFGPVGYALILGIKGVPFAYFAVAGPISSLGSSYEEAIRTHGGGRIEVLRTLGPVLLPAVFSALVVVFAESVADFGTAAVIAPNAHFPVATYNLYVALSSYPANFSEAAVIGWMLVTVVGVALAVQHHFTKRRRFATLGGKATAARIKQVGFWGQSAILVGFFAFFAIALGVPTLGALSSSMLKPLSSMSLGNLSFFAYRGIFSVTGFGSSLVFSFKMAVLNATLAVVLAAIVARRLTSSKVGLIGKLLDVTVIIAIALPGLVLAAGYIFAYNLPILQSIGLHLYGTVTVLAMAYLAGALPSSSRVLLGPMAQIQGSLLEAARVNGSRAFVSWRKAVLPLLAPSLLWAWLLTFAGTFLELPASELLAPPGVTPVSVAIVQILNKSNLYQGTALSIVALLIDLGMIVLVMMVFKVLAPKGWRRVGGRVI